MFFVFMGVPARGHSPILWKHYFLSRYSINFFMIFSTTTFTSLLRNSNYNSKGRAVALVWERRITSKRIHVERAIGLDDTFTIMQRDVLPSKFAMGSRVVFICLAVNKFLKFIFDKYA